MTLTQALRMVGFTHRPGGRHGRRLIISEHTGVIAAECDASEGWEFYRGIAGDDLCSRTADEGMRRRMQGPAA